MPDEWSNEDFRQILTAVDGKIVVTGRIPKADEIRAILANAWRTPE